MHVIHRRVYGGCFASALMQLDGTMLEKRTIPRRVLCAWDVGAQDEEGFYRRTGGHAERATDASGPRVHS